MESRELVKLVFDGSGRDGVHAESGISCLPLSLTVPLFSRDRKSDLGFLKILNKPQIFSSVFLGKPKCVKHNVLGCFVRPQN